MITLHYEVLHIQYLDSGRLVTINKKDHALLACEFGFLLGEGVGEGKEQNQQKPNRYNGFL